MLNQENCEWKYYPYSIKYHGVHLSFPYLFYLVWVYAKMSLRGLVAMVMRFFPSLPKIFALIYMERKKEKILSKCGWTCRGFTLKNQEESSSSSSAFRYFPIYKKIPSSRLLSIESFPFPPLIIFCHRNYPTPIKTQSFFHLGLFNVYIEANPFL